MPYPGDSSGRNTHPVGVIAMVSFKTYTFENVTGDHTIEATFAPNTTPTEDEIVRMFIKMNGIWVPLFEEVQAPA